MELIAKDFANIFANNAELDQKLSNFNLQNIIQILKHKKLVATHRQVLLFSILLLPLLLILLLLLLLFYLLLIYFIFTFFYIMIYSSYY